MMNIQEGYAYHIKDEFFKLIQDTHLMSNKEDGNYRPHCYAIKDKRNPELYWMIPISSQVKKFKGVIEHKMKKYGKCNTIVIGKFAGKENAFLIQNAFPIIEKYIDHVHTIERKPIRVHKELHEKLIQNLSKVIAMADKGTIITFTDIITIKKTMEKLLEDGSTN